ncbi:hypothetical protein GCM10028784_13040 [Myceligenerans cantabricum]
MNGWTPEHDDADFLSGALHGAADAMPGGEAEEVHLQFGVVRDRIGRRRAAKVGGIGVAAFAVVGGIAVGAAQLTMLDADPPLPADSSPSQSRPADPSPGPTGSAVTGWMPGDVYENTALFCGADASSIDRAADGSTIGFEGVPYSVGEGGAAVTLVGAQLRELSRAGGSLALAPAAVWVQDGEVVNLTRYFDPEPPGVTYDDAGRARTEIRLDTVDACDPPDGAQDVPSSEPVEYEHVLAAGDYRLVPVLWTEFQVGAAQYVTGAPIPVEVLPDGRVATPGAASGDGESEEPAGEPSGSPAGEAPSGTNDGDTGESPDCSASGLQDTSDFSFEPDPVAQTARGLVDAALACDLSGLEELAEPGVTQLHRAAELSVTDRFALPEGEDDVYAKLATLLSGVAVRDPDTGNYVWPTVASPEYRDDDVAWDYAVESGFATSAQADAWRAAGGEYYGWRLSITPDGAWRTFLGPDPAAG